MCERYNLTFLLPIHIDTLFPTYIICYAFIVMRPDAVKCIRSYVISLSYMQKAVLKIIIITAKVP